ncbi:MAG: TetR/AcrR family transcriptional regulator, partial [Aestuariivirgaceae bacterium]
RSIFLEGYAALAAEVTAAAAPGRPLAAVVEAVVGLFCRLFDEDRPRFAFLLLAQHDFLRQVPAERDKNLVEAVAAAFDRAMQAGEIPRRDPALVAAMALGIVAQPAVFLTYGRLQGALAERAGALCRAVLAMAREG